MTISQDRSDANYHLAVVSAQRSYSDRFVALILASALTGGLIVGMISLVNWLGNVSAPGSTSVVIALPQFAAGQHIGLLGLAMAAVIALQVAVRRDRASLDSRADPHDVARNEFLASAGLTVAVATFAITASRVFTVPEPFEVIDATRLLLEPALALLVGVFAVDAATVADPADERELRTEAWRTARRARLTAGVRALTAGSARRRGVFRPRRIALLSVPILLAGCSAIAVSGGRVTAAVAWMVLAVMLIFAISAGATVVLRMRVADDRVATVFAVLGGLVLSAYLVLARISVLASISARAPSSEGVALWGVSVVLVWAEVVATTVIVGLELGVDRSGRRGALRQFTVRWLVGSMPRASERAVRRISPADLMTSLLVPALGIGLRARGERSRGLTTGWIVAVVLLSIAFLAFALVPMLPVWSK